MAEDSEREGNDLSDGVHGATGRRLFIKQIAATVGGIVALAAGGPTAADATITPARVVVPIPDVPWRQRIYCQFDPAWHPGLLGALRKCADETGCDIVFGERDTPDLYAIGGFVLVLDRSAMGTEWLEYVEMYGDDADATPCFIIDARTDLPLPNWRFTYRMDMADPGSVATIADAVRQMKREMNRRLPDFFKRTGA